MPTRSTAWGWTRSKVCIISNCYLFMTTNCRPSARGSLLLCDRSRLCEYAAYQKWQLFLSHQRCCLSLHLTLRQFGRAPPSLTERKGARKRSVASVQRGQDRHSVPLVTEMSELCEAQAVCWGDNVCIWLWIRYEQQILLGSLPNSF